MVFDARTRLLADQHARHRDVRSPRPTLADHAQQRLRGNTATEERRSEDRLEPGLLVSFARPTGHERDERRRSKQRARARPRGEDAIEHL